MTNLIWAYTPPTSPYPPFVNMSRNDDGSVTIIVRSPPGHGPYSDQDCGASASITVSSEEWEKFKDVINK